MAKNWFQNLKNNDSIYNDYNELNIRYNSFNLSGRKDIEKIKNLKTRIDNLYNNLGKLDDIAKENAELVLDQLITELNDYLDKEMKPKLIKRKGKQFAYRGIKGEGFDFVKENGLIPDWEYSGAAGFENALFFTDNLEEANRYGEIILKFPWPSVSILANTSGMSGKYYVTNEKVNPENIQWLNSVVNKWEKL